MAFGNLIVEPRLKDSIRPMMILRNNQWGLLCNGYSKQSRNAVAWIARKKRTQ